MIYIAVQLIQIFSAGPSTGPRVTVVQEVLADLKTVGMDKLAGSGFKYNCRTNASGDNVHRQAQWRNVFDLSLKLKSIPRFNATSCRKNQTVQMVL